MNPVISEMLNYDVEVDEETATLIRYGFPPWVARRMAAERVMKKRFEKREKSDMNSDSEEE